MGQHLQSANIGRSRALRPSAESHTGLWAAWLQPQRMLGWLLAGLLVLGGSLAAQAARGIFQSYAIVNAAGTVTYRAGGANADGAPLFASANLGTFVSGGTLTLAGEVKTFKNGSDDVTGATLFYRVYRTGTTAGSFLSINLPFSDNLATPGDQKWTNFNNTLGNNTPSPVNLLSGVTVQGNYTVEVYWTASTNTGTVNEDNAGNYYRATFNYTSTTLAGDYTINPAGSGGNNFISFAAAFTALNAATLSGATTFNVTRTTYNEPRLSLNAVTGASSTNTITFTPATGGRKPLIIPSVIGAGIADAIVSLNGADFVTFDRIDVQENVANTTATTQSEFGYVLLRQSVTNGCQNNEIKGCAIYLTKAGNNTTSAGIYAAPGTAPTATSGTHSNNKFNADTVAARTSVNAALVGAQTGIYLNGSTNAFFETGNEIGTTNGNVLTAIGGGAAATVSIGIRCEFQQNLKVENNTIAIVAGASSGATIGISFGTAGGVSSFGGTVLIKSNTITMTGAVTGTTAGIRNNNSGLTTAGASQLTTVSITDNIIRNFSITGSAVVAFISDVSVPATSSTISGNQIYGNATVAGANFISRLPPVGSAPTSFITGNFIGQDNLGAVSANTMSGASGTANLVAIGLGSVSVTNNRLTNTRFTGVSGSTAGALFGVSDVNAVASVLTITGNTITDLSILGTTTGTTTLYGLRIGAAGVTGATSHTINGNTIGALSAVAGSTCAVSGIFLANSPSAGPNSYTGNKIYDLTANGTTGVVTGINVTNGSTVNINNNLIGDLKAPAATSATAVVGINAGAGTANVYFNTVYLSASGGAGFGSAAINVTGGNLDLRSNILVNNSTVGTAVAYRRTTALTTTNYINGSNNNLFYAGVPGASNLIFFDGTNSDPTLATFKTRAATLAPARDAASVTENPTFISTSGSSVDFLHINTTTGTVVESGGVAVTGITTDFDGNLRFGQVGYTGGGSAPDIGADEGTFLVVDVVAPVIAYTALGNTASTGNRTLVSTITDNVGISAALIYYRVNAGAYTSAAATSVAGSTYTFTIGTSGLAAADVVTYYVAARDAAGNVTTSPAGGSGLAPGPGSTPPGAPNSYTIVPSLSGDYYVLAGAASGTSPGGAGREYATLTAAVAAYNGSGMAGPVTFFLFGTNYTGETFPITITANGDASAINLLTIKPHTGVTAGFTTASAAALLQLDDADFVVLDGSNTTGGTTRDWTLTTTNATQNTGAVALRSLAATTGNGARFVTVRNLVLTGTGANPAFSFGVFAGGATISNSGTSGQGADNDNLTVQNNLLTGLSHGVYAAGTAAVSAGGNDNLSLVGNTIGQAVGNTPTRRGFELINAVNYDVSRNVLQNLQSAGQSFGIIVGASGGTANTITRNRMANLIPAFTAVQGIQVNAATSSANLVIANNMIQLSANAGSTTLGNANGGIVLGSGTSTGGVRVYNNSVNLTGSYSSTTSDFSAALALGAFVSGTANEVVNNVLVNNLVNTGAGAATTKAYALYAAPAVPNTVLAASNHNDYYVTGSQGILAVLGGTDRVTLAAVQTATGRDAQSVSAEPLFVSATDLHVTQNFNPLESAGQLLTGVVDNDLDGDIRQGSPGYAGTGSRPDIGADETSTVPAGPLSGIYTVNNTQPTDPTGTRNFISFSEAFSAMNNGSIAASLTFNVSAGQTFAENPPVLTANASSNGSITVTFQKAGAGANPVLQPTGTASPADAGIALSGGDYFTFDGIDVITTSATMEYGYLVRNASAGNGANNNTIRNATISLVRNTTTTAAVMQTTNASFGGAVAATSAAGTNQNNRYLDLTILSVANGIVLRGTSDTFFDNNTEIARCTVGSSPTAGTIGSGAFSAGFQGSFVRQLSVHDNVVQGVSNGTATPGTDIAAGLYFSNISGTGGGDASNFYNNTVTRIVGTTSVAPTASTGVYGIYLKGSPTTAYHLNAYGNVLTTIQQNSISDASTVSGIYYSASGNTAGSVASIYNNAMSSLISFYSGAATTNRVVRGIFLELAGTTAAGTTVNTWFNTVSIGAGQAAGTAHSSVAFEINNATGALLDTRNNLFANGTLAQTSPAVRYAYVSPSATQLGGAGSVSDYNNLFVANAGAFIGNGGGTDRLTLTDWVSNGEGPNSISVNPVFSATLRPTTSSAIGMGVVIGAVTTDQAGATRSIGIAPFGPTMGAYEVVRPTAAFDAAITPVCAGVSQTLTGTLIGTAPFTGFYRVNGGAAQALPIVGSTFSIVTGGLATTSDFTISVLNDANTSALPLPAATVTVTVNTATTWTGATSSNWFDASNWNNCLPNSLINATIPTGLTTYPVYTSASGSATASTRNLTIDAGATLTYSAGTLEVFGSLANAGTLTLTETNLGTGAISGTVLTPRGTGTTSLSGVSEVYDLTVNAANLATTVALAGNLQVNHTLTMTQGILNTGSFAITLAKDNSLAAVPNATISETDASYVTGAVSTSRLLATAGTGDSFGGLGLALTPDASSTALPGLTAVTRNTGTALTGAAMSVSVQRWFRITPTVDAGLNMTLRMDLFDHERNSITNANLRLFSTPTPVGGGSPNGGPWTRLASALVTPGAGAYATGVQTTGLTHLSDWTLGNSAAPLPVTLTRFAAVREGNNAVLTWATASEKDNAGFETQMSADGFTFRKLGFVAAQGQGSPQTYSYADTEAGKTGMRYYRLKQLDTDGSASYSPVSAVRFDKTAATVTATLQLAPNPFKGEALLTVTSAKATAAAKLWLTDVAGRALLEQTLALNEGTNALPLTGLTKLPTGVYFLHLKLDGQVLHLRVAKD